MLRPLGDRVLLRPVFPGEDDGPILRPENASRDLPTVGRVLAVGEAPARLQRQTQALLASLADSLAHLPPADAADVGCGAVRRGDVLALLETAQRRLAVPPEIAVGQLVVFDPLAAHDLIVNDDPRITVPVDAVIAELTED